jgi:hypothetical protein
MTAIEKTQEQRNLDHVRQIADNIENGLAMEEHNDGYEPDYPEQLISGFDYLSDVYDIEYIVNSDGEFKSARILVAFGGPNIWIDFQTKSVELYWWGDRATAYFTDDAMDVEGALRGLWECR